MAKLGANNISVTLVKSTLGAGTNDIGTLCKHENINMWSRWKPIKYSGITLTEDALKNNNYGIKIKQDFFSSIGTIITRNWEYVRPTGGASSMYRLGDFRNYVHDAKPVFDKLQDISITITDQQSGIRTFRVFSPVQVSGGVTVDNLQAGGQYIKDLHFGIVIFEGTNIALIQTSADKITNGSYVEITVDLHRLEGKYKIGYFVTKMVMLDPIIYPAASQIPTTDVFFLDGGIRNLYIDNKFATINFPYIFWDSSEYAKRPDGKPNNYNTDSYTVTMTGGAVIRNYTDWSTVYFPGNKIGALVLDPVVTFMNDFPSLLKTIEIEPNEGGWGNWHPRDYANGHTEYRSVLQFEDIDANPVTVYIKVVLTKYEYEGSEVFEWAYYLGMASEDFNVPEQILFTSDEFGGEGTYYDITKIKLEQLVSGGTGGTNEIKVTVYTTFDRNPREIRKTNLGFNKLSQVKFGEGSGMVVPNKGLVFPDPIPEGDYFFKYFSPSL